MKKLMEIKEDTGQETGGYEGKTPSNQQAIEMSERRMRRDADERDDDNLSKKDRLAAKMRAMMDSPGAKEVEIEVKSKKNGRESEEEYSEELEEKKIRKNLSKAALKRKMVK